MVEASIWVSWVLMWMSVPLTIRNLDVEGKIAKPIVRR